MKTFGLLVSLFAFIMAFFALFMDVTIPTAMGNRVVNIHLATQQQNLLMISLMILIFGVVLMIIGRKSKESTKKEKKLNNLFEEFPTEKGWNYKLRKKDGVSFKIIKEKILDFYNKKGFEIKIDNEQILFIKSTSTDAYVEVKDKGSLVILSIWDTEKPSFIQELYIINKTEDETNKIIELSKMLEKELISKEEFLSLKKDILQK